MGQEIFFAKMLKNPTPPLSINLMYIPYKRKIKWEFNVFNLFIIHEQQQQEQKRLLLAAFLFQFSSSMHNVPN